VPTPSDPNAANEVGSIALQPEWLGARIEDAQLNAATDPTLASVKDAMANYPYASAKATPTPPPTGTPGTNFPYAWGKFDTVYPDADGICKVSSITTSTLTYPDIPQHLASATVASPLGTPTYITATAGPAAISPIASTACTNENAATVCTTGTCVTDDNDQNGICATSCSADTDCPSDQGCQNGICLVPDNPETQVTYTWSNVRVYVDATSVGLQTFANLTVSQDGCTVKYNVSILVPRVLCANGNDNSKEPSLCDPNADGLDNPFGSGIAPTIAASCENLSTDPDPANADWECLPPKTDPISQLE
jgi:hypothetical protein